MTGLMTGLDASLLARGSYIFVRNIIYKMIYDAQKPENPNHDLTQRGKNAIAAFAGGVGAIVSNPFEVVMVRKQCDSALRPEIRRNYGNVLESIGRISAEEGAAGLMAGVKFNIAKAVVLNTTMSVPYNYLKEGFYNVFGDMACNRPLSLAVAAAVATYCTIPFDNVKWRLQQQFPDHSLNRISYSPRTLEMLIQILRTEEWQGFFVGVTPFYYKTYAYGLCTFLIVDYLTERWKKQAGLRPEQM